MAVESTIVDLDDIPVSHLTELAKLPLAQAVQEIQQPLVKVVLDAAMQEPKIELNYSPDADLEAE